MQDVMVAARMPKEREEAVDRALRSLGQDASQMVNQLYGYPSEDRKSSFVEKEQMRPGARTFSSERLAETKAFLDSISLSTGNRSFAMTVDEIREDRSASRGSLDRVDVARDCSLIRAS